MVAWKEKKDFYSASAKIQCRVGGAAPLVVVRAPSSAKRKRPYAFGDLLAADPRLVDLIELGTAADVCDAVLDAGLK